MPLKKTIKMVLKGNGDVLECGNGIGMKLMGYTFKKKEISSENWWRWGTVSLGSGHEGRQLMH